MKGYKKWQFGMIFNAELGDNMMRVKNLENLVDVIYDVPLV